MKSYQDHLVAIVCHNQVTFTKAVNNWELHEDLDGIPDDERLEVMGVSHSVSQDHESSTTYTAVVWVRHYREESE